jgi:Cytochrome c7 and related cytochrome c
VQSLSFRRPRWRLLLLALVAAAPACGLLSRGGASHPPAANATWRGTPPVFSRAHESTGEALRHFFNMRPEAVQPVAFPHKTHVEQEITCTDYCHESATKGPIAGLPSVNTCMICHTAIATDKPIIQAITERQAKGLDLAWQRVYGFPPEAHVRFNHAAHLRAGVECATCHGNVAQQGVAERVVDHTMNFCVSCHKQKQASNDCLVCHY